jgi:hypothetical protein
MRVGAAGDMLCAEDGVGRFGREVVGCSSDSNGKAMEEGRSAVRVGGRADETKEEEGRMDVAVGGSVVERKVEDGP